jgi:thioredoxin-like negative regulator of GroEL
MSDAAAPPGALEEQRTSKAASTQLRLVFFYAPTSGRCRRTEGHLAQALQRRRNHDTFELVPVDVEKRPDLAERFRVEEVPTLVVVEGPRAVRRIVAPRGSRALARELAEWLH